MKTAPKPLLLALLLSSLATTGCEYVKKVPAPAELTTNKLSQKPTCTNPNVLSDIPAEWTPINVSDFIDGAGGHYKLIQAQLYKNLSGKRTADAKAEVILLDQVGAAAPEEAANFTQTLCYEASDSNTLEILAFTPDSIARKDGLYTAVRKISFSYPNQENVPSVTLVSKEGNYLQEQLRSDSDFMKRAGLQLTTKYLRVSATDIEVRFEYKKNIKEGASLLAGSLRYRLVAE